MPSNPHYTQVTLLKIGATFCQFLKTTTRCSKISKTFPPPLDTKKYTQISSPSLLKNPNFEFFNFDMCVIVQMVPNFERNLGGPIGSQRYAQISITHCVPIFCWIVNFYNCFVAFNTASIFRVVISYFQLPTLRASHGL